MKKTMLSIIIIISTLLFSYPAFAQKLDISDDCTYILIDSKSGQVIAEKNADVKVRPASTTKIMTAIIALENGKLDSIMNVSKNAVYDIGEGGMHIGINPGEANLTLENLLNATLIKSANECANIIAENIFGSRDEFIRKMNEKAMQLGAINTHFVNPCGKDDTRAEDQHLSTAHDMAIMARYAMTIPKFREIVMKEYYTEMPKSSAHPDWIRLRTTNRLLWKNNKYEYTLGNSKHFFSVEGIKTGYTSAAGNNVISSAVDENGMELIAAVMHVKKGKVFDYSRDLLRYGFEHFSNQKVMDSGKLITTVKVEDAKGNGSLDLVSANAAYFALPFDKSTWNIAAKEVINSIIKAPVKKGDILGAVEYKRNGILLGKVDLIANSTVEKKTTFIANNISKNSNVLYVMIFIALFIILLAFILPRFIKTLLREKDI